MKVAIIQARTGSSRLPGKILKNLGEMTVIETVYKRVLQTKGLDKIIVAMPEGESDDDLAACVASFCPTISRGSETDVLDRFYRAAMEYDASVVVRITSDCPFFDPDILTAMLKSFEHNEIDYMTNTLDPHLPRGLDAEVFTMKALGKAWRFGTELFHREHVTPFIYQSPEIFSVQGYRSRTDNHSKLRWTLDTPEDWTLITKIHSLLKIDILDARLDDFLEVFYSDPDLGHINSAIEQKTLSS